MKIDSSSLVSSLPVAGGAKARTEKSLPASSTNVSLSDASSRLQALEAEALHSSSRFDAARVAALKQAISEGKFQINPRLIADKLIETARDLINSQE